MKDDLREQLRKAGIKLPERLPHGTLIAGFRIPHRAVPWKAPHTTRTGHAFKDKGLAAWQETVKLYARTAMGGNKPYAFPVKLDLTFWIKPGGNPGDTSNYTKSCEDALQGIVFLNDRQVCENHAKRQFADEDEVLVEAFASEEE